MAGGPAADPRLPSRYGGIVPDAAQFELLVDIRRHFDVYADGANRDRHRAGHALYAGRRSRLQFRRAYHARRELRLAPALSAFQRRVDVLLRGLRTHFSRHVLRVLQVAAGSFVDPRRHYLSADDGHRLHGLCAALGADELLGRDRHHQPVLRHSGGRRYHRDVAVGRLFGRQSDVAAVLLPALSAAVRDPRRGGAAHLGAPCGRPEQSGRRRPQDRQGDGAVHALCDPQGRVFPRAVCDRLCVVHVRNSELHRPCGQLHPGQSGGDAVAHCAGMVLSAVLRDPALDPEQAVGRGGDVLVDRNLAVPALARHVAGQVGGLPAAVQAVLLAVRPDLRAAGLARIEAAGRRLRHPVAAPDGVVLPLLPRRAAGAGPDRAAEAGAELDLGRP